MAHWPSCTTSLLLAGERSGFPLPASLPLTAELCSYWIGEIPAMQRPGRQRECWRLRARPTRPAPSSTFRLRVPESTGIGRPTRSEERRVGEEGGAWWAVSQER